MSDTSRQALLTEFLEKNQEFANRFFQLGANECKSSEPHAALHQSQTTAETIERIQNELDETQRTLQESDATHKRKIQELEETLVDERSKRQRTEDRMQQFLREKELQEEALQLRIKMNESQVATRTRNESLDRIMNLASALERSTTTQEHQKGQLCEAKEQIQRLESTINEFQTKLLRITEPALKTPGQQGSEGEKETEEQLRRCFGHFLIVENVSKIGQGKQMDLRLMTFDEKIRISIDCKNYLGHGGLPEKEVLRFNKDMDEMTPKSDACILFSRPPTKGPNERWSKSKRGNTYRYHVGDWSFFSLVAAIHDAILSVRADHTALQAIPPTAGGLDDGKTTRLALDPAVPVELQGKRQVQSAIREMTSLIYSQNEALAQIANNARTAHSRSNAQNRLVADAIQEAHSAQPQAVPEDILQEFEGKLPKQARGRPPKVQRQQTEAETTGRTETTRKQKQKQTKKPSSTVRKPKEHTAGQKKEVSEVSVDERKERDDEDFSPEPNGSDPHRKTSVSDLKSHVKEPTPAGSKPPRVDLSRFKFQGTQGPL